MPASFDSELKIDDEGCLVAVRGPTGLEPGETGLRLDAWIFQPGGACVTRVLALSGPEWTVKPNHHDDHFGAMFEPGPATAVGLMVKKNVKGETIVEKWSRGVTLI